MTFRYISLEEILRLHYQIIADYGGSHGIRDEGSILSITEARKQNAFGVDQYPSLFDKAAAYVRSIIGDHPFIDGNKRTAVTVCGIFLARHNKPLRCLPINLEAFVLKVATEHIEIKEISYWLSENTK